MPGKTTLITGQIIFPEDQDAVMDVIVRTIEPAVAADMYVNQVVLASAFFGKGEIKTQSNSNVSLSIGVKNDNQDQASWLRLEIAPALFDKLEDRRKTGRKLTALGYLREYRKDGSEGLTGLWSARTSPPIMKGLERDQQSLARQRATRRRNRRLISPLDPLKPEGPPYHLM